MFDANDLTITSIETITAFDIVTGAFKFVLDELQSATIAQSQEKTDITGKQGRKLSSLKKNKSVKISGNNGMVSGGLMELQTGCDFESKATTVMWSDYMTVTGNEATAAYKAVGTVGNEIESVYVKSADGTLGKKLTQGATVAKGEFAYDPATNKLTFYAGQEADTEAGTSAEPADVPDGTEIVAYYKRKIQGDVLVNMSDAYSGKCALYVDAFGEDKCANVYRIQFFIPKADFSGDFSIEFGDNQSVHAFEAESLSGGCGTGGIGSALWTYTVFGANAEDVEDEGDAG